MSYDLYFLVPATREEVTWQEFESHFAGRPNYTIQDRQAIYVNEDTGASFGFEWDEALDPADEATVDDEAPDDGLGPAGVRFGINFNRPFWFIEEALPHVRAFIDAFGLSVDDPQVEGLGRGRFTDGGFIRSWTANNMFAVARASMSEGTKPTTMDRGPVRAAWSWNRDRPTLQARLGESVFVPRVFFYADRDETRTAISWAWEVPTLIPPIDSAILAWPPRGFLGRLRQADFGLADHATLLSVAEPAPEFGRGVRRSKPFDDPAVIRLFHETPRAQPLPTSPASWAVFEREDVEAAIARGAGRRMRFDALGHLVPDEADSSDPRKDGD